MRKTKIIFIVSAVALVVAILLGLLAIFTPSTSLKQISANPKAYIETGLKKSFAASPIGDIVTLEDPEAIALDVAITPTLESGHMNLNAIIALKELGILAQFDAEVEGEEFNGKFFLDKNNLAVNSDILQEIFGSASVGISLNDFMNHFKQSDWYQLLIVDSGLDEELKKEDGSDIDIQAILDLVVETATGIAKIYKDSVVYDVIETSIEVDGKTIEGYQIIQKRSDDVKDKTKAVTNSFSTKLQELLPEDFAEYAVLIIESLTDSIIDMIDDTSTQTTYTIAKNSGAVIELKYERTMEVVDELLDKKSTNSIKCDVNFGANPENIFAPQFELEIVDGKTKHTVTGKSTVDVVTKTLKMDIDTKTEYPDYQWIKEPYETTTTTITIDKDGNYKLTAKFDDEEIELGGKFKVDGTVAEISFDINEGSETIHFVIKIDFNAKKPIAFEYDDLIQWDEEKILDLLEKFS